ncbi:PQQ-dependent sugar dehydrogenase [Glaciecola sp. 1036]|uniref:PQQ-dependent sugar dehydrogenase n=1 Tax=Alteromonadaceae TaxID=72275 RepID=UPI003D03D6D3
MRHSLTGAFISASLLVCATASAEAQFTVTEVTDGLKHPWGMAFLPNQDLLITERNGGLRLLSKEGKLSGKISGLPESVQMGQGGNLGIAIDPDFATNNKVYVCSSMAGDGGFGSEVHVGEFTGQELVNVKKVFTALPKKQTPYHFGCRIVFDKQGMMFVSLGERGSFKEEAQNTDNHLGTVVRIHPDGSVPEDNPFVDGQAPEVFTYGHRNVQGMTVHPETGEIWTHEHGPRGGDEVNILSKGDNYGWPEITYGINYNGSIITDKKEMEGMRQPLQYWDPSFAPSGMTFYTGDMFPEWQGDLFIGSLKFMYLKHLKIENGKILGEENLLQDQQARFRDVVQGPDGAIYVLTDSSDGKVLKISK